MRSNVLKLELHTMINIPRPASKTSSFPPGQSEAWGDDAVTVLVAVTVTAGLATLTVTAGLVVVVVVVTVAVS